MKTLLKLPEPRLVPEMGARWNRKLENVFPDRPDLWHCVYLIGSKRDLKDFRLRKLYVGETAQPEQRFIDHGNAGKTRHDRELFHLINKRGWTFEENCLVITFGHREDCLLFEADLRPIPGMGLNRKAGGRKHQRWDEPMSLADATEFAQSRLMSWGVSC